MRAHQDGDTVIVSFILVRDLALSLVTLVPRFSPVPRLSYDVRRCKHIGAIDTVARYGDLFLFAGCVVTRSSSECKVFGRNENMSSSRVL